MQVGQVDAFLDEFGLGDLPCGRSFGCCHVDLCVGLIARRGEGVELEGGNGRGQDDDLGTLAAHVHLRHTFTEESALDAAVGGFSVGVVFAIYAATHDEVARCQVLARGHEEFTHLRSEDDGI